MVLQIQLSILQVTWISRMNAEKLAQTILHSFPAISKFRPSNKLWTKEILGKTHIKSFSAKIWMVKCNQSISYNSIIKVGQDKDRGWTHKLTLTWTLVDIREVMGVHKTNTIFLEVIQVMKWQINSKRRIAGSQLII